MLYRASRFDRESVSDPGFGPPPRSPFDDSREELYKQKLDQEEKLKVIRRKVDALKLIEQQEKDLQEVFPPIKVKGCTNLFGKNLLVVGYQSKLMDNIPDMLKGEEGVKKDMDIFLKDQTHVEQITENGYVIGAEGGARMKVQVDSLADQMYTLLFEISEKGYVIQGPNIVKSIYDIEGLGLRLIDWRKVIKINPYLSTNQYLVTNHDLSTYQDLSKDDLQKVRNGLIADISGISTLNTITDHFVLTHIERLYDTKFALCCAVADVFFDTDLGVGEMEVLFRKQLLEKIKTPEHLEYLNEIRELISETPDTFDWRGVNHFVKKEWENEIRAFFDEQSQSIRLNEECKERGDKCKRKMKVEYDRQYYHTNEIWKHIPAFSLRRTGLTCRVRTRIDDTGIGTCVRK